MGSNMDDVKGRIKEGVGAATDDPDLEREGKLDRAGGAVKDAADKAGDKIAKGVDAVKDKLTDRH
ncbi:MAG: CsbD family protein [Actinobacteria bacterium]|nr:CsbD family protein [Actinomycetota bacterium]